MRVFDFRIVGKVIVRRSWMGNSLVVVCCVGSWVSWVFGKSDAVWPSGPMPRMQISNWLGSSLAYFSRASSIGSEVSK